LHGVNGKNEDDNERKEEKTKDSGNNNQSSIESVHGGEVSVFPDDVSWLRSFLYYKFNTAEFSDISELIIFLDDFVVALSSVKTFFILKSKETRDRSSAIFHVISDVLINFSIHFSHLIIFLVLDVASSFFKKVNDFSVIKSETDHSDFNLLRRFLFISKIRKSGKSVFHFGLQVISELSQLGFRKSDIEFFVLKVLVHLLRQVHLNGVISSCDCLDIPFNVVIFAITSNIIDIDDNEK
jgi:hypothetical protein